MDSVCRSNRAARLSVLTLCCSALLVAGPAGTGRAAAAPVTPATAEFCFPMPLCGISTYTVYAYARAMAERAVQIGTENVATRNAATAVASVHRRTCAALAAGAPTVC